MIKHTIEEFHMNLELADIQGLEDKTDNSFTVAVHKIERINP